MARSLRVHVFALAILAVCCLTDSANAATTTLQLLARAVLSSPISNNTGPGTEQVVFDDGEKVAYLVGGSILYVVDLAPESLQPSVTQAQPRALSVLQTLTLPTTVNDLSFCATRQGGYLAVSANGGPQLLAEDGKVLPGSVTLFQRYLRAGGPASLQQLAMFTVGALPDQLEFSRDCRTILVSNEGEPRTYSPASLANDPEGSVSVINLHFCESPGDYVAYAAAKPEESADKYASAEKEEAVEPERHAKHSHSPYSGKGPYTDRPYDHAPHKYEQPPEYEQPSSHGPYSQHGPYDRSSPYPQEPYPSHTRSIECTGGGVYGRVRTARFTAWNDQKALLESQGVKLTGINATVAQDLEPEYTTFAADEKMAFVTLQENNAVAVLDVEKAVITSIHSLGWKDHNNAANPFDPSDLDGPAPLINNWPVYGMYQPDETRSFRFKGVDYIVTANEGDARSWPGLEEEARGGNIKNKAPAFFNLLSNNAQLGRLNVLTVNGNPYPPYSDPTNPASGNFTRLFAFGARSFSIWRLDKDPGGASLVQVYDSAAQLEQISLAQTPDIWNSELGNVGNSSYDKRSDNKGPEPEGVAIGPCNAAQRTRPYADADPAEPEYYRREPHTPYPREPENPYRRDPESYYPREPESYYRVEPEQERLCLFLGTERLGVVYVYDISNPYRPQFQSVARPPVASDGKSLSAPEGLTYARYTDGPESYSLVLVAYEADTGNALLPGGLGVYLVTEA